MKYILTLLLGMVILAATAQKRTYEYDDLNRLSKVSVYNGTTLTHTVTYNYDDMGNRLSKVVSSSTTPTQTIAINSPISGTFTAGQSVTVTYASTGGTGNVSLELVSCTGTTPLSVIADGVAASGSTNHILPNNLTTGQYRIKAYVTGTSGDPYYGSCFTVNAIATQSIAISNPTSGTFTAGQSVSVSYASTNGSANVSLELVSCSSTTALAVISANAAASGNTNYTLPTSLTAGSYRIKSYVTSAPEQAFYGTCFTVNASSGGDCPPTISHSGNITANTYNASQTIVSTAPVPNNTKYYAGQSVTLLPGFGTGVNGNFEVRIQGCNTSTAPTNGLVAYYPFNGNANDESGNNYHGTIDGATLATDRKGVASRAFNFNGTNSRIRVEDTPNLNFSSSFSISFWAKMNAWGNGISAGIISKKVNDVGNGYVFYNDGGHLNKINFRLKGISATNNIMPSNTTVSIGSWEFWTMIYNASNGTTRIYKNGIFDISHASVNIGSMSNTAPLYFGYSQTWNGYLNGLLDEIRIYNRAITNEEVLQIYNAEKP